MPSQWSYFPSAMTPDDLCRLRKAFQRACAISKFCDESDLDLLARAVFRCYERGMTEPDRLAEMACFMCRYEAPRNAAMAVPNGTAHVVHIARSRIPVVPPHRADLDKS